MESLTNEILGQKCNRELEGDLQGMVVEAITNEKKIDAQTIGLCIYGEPNIYNKTGDVDADFESNSKIHLLNGVKELMQPFAECLQEAFKAKFAKIIMGHEHGSDLNKCHFQCMIRFSKRFNRVAKPFTMEFQRETYLIIFQKANSPRHLAKYCKKDRDVFEWTPGFTRKEDVYSMLVADPMQTREEVIDLLGRHDPAGLMKFGEKILGNFQTLVQSQEIPSFKWSYPKHLDDRLINAQRNTLYEQEEYSKLLAIRKWFDEQCVPDLTRRQALFLVSEERGLGKTELAKQLVNDPAYYVYCRSSLDGGAFTSKAKTARLIILDDIYFAAGEREMWKALMGGEQVTINTKFQMVNWERRIPCIVITNAVSTAEFFSTCQEFRTQCCFINIREYLGPSGTRPDFLTTVTDCFDSDFKMKMREISDAKQFKKILK